MDCLWGQRSLPPPLWTIALCDFGFAYGPKDATLKREDGLILAETICFFTFKPMPLGLSSHSTEPEFCINRYRQRERAGEYQFYWFLSYARSNVGVMEYRYHHNDVWSFTGAM